MMAELGGAFTVSWVIGFGGAMATLPGAVALAVVWMAFSGAHVLPMVTWCNMMTGDLADAEGNWMANGMRLVAQMIGAVLAILLATEAGGIETGGRNDPGDISDIRRAHADGAALIDYFADGVEWLGVFQALL